MSDLDIRIRARGGMMRMPRSRGAATGLLLVLLGLWGALVPFLGPHINFAFTPEQEWTWTAGRGWLQILPGVVTVAGGLLLTFSGNRATAILGAWMSGLAGAWFVAGKAAAAPLGLGTVHAPPTATDVEAAWLELIYFTGPGALIIFLAALCIGRLSVRSLRDVRHADGQAALVQEHSGRVAEPAESQRVEPVHESATAPDDASPRRRRLPDLFRRQHATSDR